MDIRKTTQQGVVIMSWSILVSVLATTSGAAELPIVLRQAKEHDRVNSKPTTQFAQTFTGLSVNHLARSYSY